MKTKHFNPKFVAVLVAGILLTPVTHSAIAYIRYLWSPFESETVSVPIWAPEDARLLNEAGYPKFTSVRIQAPTVITLKDRESFAEAAKAAERVEVAVSTGSTQVSNSPERCLDVCYVAHGRETSYVLWETVLQPDTDVRGWQPFENMRLVLRPLSVGWYSENWDTSALWVASVALVLGVLALWALASVALYGAARLVILIRSHRTPPNQATAA